MTEKDTPPTQDESAGRHRQASSDNPETVATPEEVGLLRRVVPDFVREKFLFKVLFGLVVVILISGGIGIVTYQGISESLADDVETQIRATTTLHENAYDEWFSDRRAELDGVIENTDLEGTGYGRISIDLNAARAESEYISAFYLVDRQSGEILASSDVTVNGQNLAETGIDTQFLQETSFVYPGQYESQSGYPALAFGADASKQNNVDRMLIAEINATNADLSQGEDPPIQQTFEKATTSVLTQDGQHVIGNDVSGEILAESTDDVVIRETSGEIRGYQQISSESQFIVVTQTPTEEAFALRNAVLRNFGFTLAVAFLILTGVTVLGSRLLSRNLTVLIERLQTVGSGNLDVDLSTNRLDEIGVVYREFDTMRRNLQAQMQEVRQSREELEQYNEQITVLDRMLRHNLNNQLNVISLYASQITQSTSEDSSEAAAKILDTCTRILTRIDKQRQITKMLSGDIDRQPIDTVGLCRSAIQSMTDQYPGVKFDLDVPESAPALTTYAMENALTEVIENAIIHNENDEKRVAVTVSNENGRVVIDVIDNGPGIPEMERSVFEEDTTIDPLNHSQGIGLWLVYWTVQMSEGDLHFADADGDRTRVTIELPEPTDTLSEP